MPSKALAVPGQMGGELVPFEELIQQAGKLVKTGFLPRHITSPEQAVAVALMGRELGLPMMYALRKIHVIQGTPGMAAELMLAKARATNEVTEFKVEDDGHTCKVTMRRKQESPHTESFSMDDARDLGLAGKDNWKKQAKVMRRWRAIGACCRLLFPDALGGISHSIEELAPDVVVDSMGNPTGDVPQLPDRNHPEDVKEWGEERLQKHKDITEAKTEENGSGKPGAVGKEQLKELNKMCKEAGLKAKESLELFCNVTGRKITKGSELTLMDYSRLKMKFDKVKSGQAVIEKEPMRISDAPGPEEGQESIPF